MEGKAHFNCSTLEGVQLEDQGGDGTTGSHWEARITRVRQTMNGMTFTMMYIITSNLNREKE